MMTSEHPLRSRLIDLSCDLDRRIPLLHIVWYHLWRLALWRQLRRLNPE